MSGKNKVRLLVVQPVVDSSKGIWFTPEYMENVYRYLKENVSGNEEVLLAFPELQPGFEAAINDLRKLTEEYRNVTVLAGTRIDKSKRILPGEEIGKTPHYNSYLVIGEGRIKKVMKKNYPWLGESERDKVIPGKDKPEDRILEINGIKFGVAICSEFAPDEVYKKEGLGKEGPEKFLSEIASHSDVLLVPALKDLNYTGDVEGGWKYRGIELAEKLRKPIFAYGPAGNWFGYGGRTELFVPQESLADWEFWSYGEGESFESRDAVAYTITEDKFAIVDITLTKEMDSVKVENVKITYY